MMLSNLNLSSLPECNFEVRYVDSVLLNPCAEYQRLLRMGKVARIAANFSEYIANEPKVSYRDGRYFVFDGQNTIEARKTCNGGRDLPIRSCLASCTAWLVFWLCIRANTAGNGWLAGCARCTPRTSPGWHRTILQSTVRLIFATSNIGKMIRILVKLYINIKVLTSKYFCGII